MTKYIKEFMEGFGMGGGGIFSFLQTIQYIYTTRSEYICIELIKISQAISYEMVRALGNCLVSR
jgi:hypothetical protein